MCNGSTTSAQTWSERAISQSEFGLRKEAYSAYDESLRIRRKIVTADQSSVMAQTNLAVGLYKVSTAADAVLAVEAMREAIALVDTLERAGKLNGNQRQWPRIFRETLAKLSAPQAGAN